MSETLIGLVSQYSPSGQELNAVEWLVRRMKTLGYTDAYIDGAGNAVGVMGKGSRQMVLLGHIDTVSGEISVRVEEDIVYGRGVVDAKGPLACFVDAAAQVNENPDWKIIVVGAVDEERDSSGARFIAGQYQPEYAVIGEPNQWDRIALGYKGVVHTEITIQRGKTHSASAEQTVCEAAVKVWQAIEASAASFNASKGRIFDKVMPSLQGFNSGGDEFNQWARLDVNTRLPLDLNPEQWIALLKSAAGDAEVQPVGSAIPAWVCEKNTPLIRAFISAIRSQNASPVFVFKTGTADLNIVAPVWQCPALVYGPGDSSLDHTPNEKLSLQEYRKSVQVLRSALGQIIQ